MTADFEVIEVGDDVVEVLEVGLVSPLDDVEVLSITPGSVGTPGRPPTGGAGGVLSGQYPNPGFAVNMTTQAEHDEHVAAPEPHPAYDDLPSFRLAYENALI